MYSLDSLLLSIPISHHLDSTQCVHWADPWKFLLKQDENYTRMLLAVLNKSWKQHLTKQLSYGHLYPIKEIIQDDQDILSTAGNTKYKLRSGFLLLTSTQFFELITMTSALFFGFISLFNGISTLMGYLMLNLH